jgi:hypothetical protein
MPLSEDISRRSLIKLMVMASPAMSGFTPSLASTEHSDEPVAGQRLHPWLFYNVTSLERMRQTLASDVSANTALQTRGEELLAAAFVPEKVAEIGGGQQANYVTPASQIAEMGLTLGLLFHLTGDMRYADKLRDAMLYYTHYVRWAGQGLADRFPPWHSELDTALFSFGYSTGYDALRHVLSDADRKTIADEMVRLAVLPILDDWVLPGARVHSFDSMGHNWWGVCVAGGGLCSLALLGDDPRAREWIDAVDAGFVQWFDYSGNVLQNRMPTFERSGPSYEGVLYTNYGVSEYLHYRLAWQNTFPGRKAAHMEPLDHIASCFLQSLYPTSTEFYTVNFGDSPSRVDLTTTMLLLLACGLGTPDGSRYLEHVHTNPQGTLLTLLRQHSKPNVRGDALTSCIYPEMGWAMMRSSWDNDATFLAMKSGYTWNHAHADAGSFVLYKQGAPLIIDSGTCAYSRPEYTTYYRQSHAHNVILFDGAGQPEEDINYGCKFPGQMHSLIDGLGIKYAYADATGPMARWFRRNYRHWLWSGDVILVIDTVLAYTAGKMDWLLHYGGEYTANANGSITLKNGPAEAVVTMLYPPNKRREDIGLADHNPDKKVPYLVFYPETSAQSQQFITAICLNPEAVPKFEVLEGPDYLGVRVQTQHAVEETYLNLRSVNGSTSTGIVIGDWATDTYLLHLSRPSSGDAAVQRYFLSDGSYLRRGNRSILESLSKFTACWSLGDSVEVFSDDASDSIQIAAEHLPRSVRWNDSPIATLYDKQKKLATLKRTR